jgi:hypothetical protein
MLWKAVVDFVNSPAPMRRMKFVIVTIRAVCVELGINTNRIRKQTNKKRGGGKEDEGKEGKEGGKGNTHYSD